MKKFLQDAGDVCLFFLKTICVILPWPLFFCLIIFVANITEETSDWHTVTVIERTAIQISVPFNGTETEVRLKFSDGSEWTGSFSRSRSHEHFLLHKQKNSQVTYRYNSSYFSGREWR